MCAVYLFTHCCGKRGTNYLRRFAPYWGDKEKGPLFRLTGIYQELKVGRQYKYNSVHLCTTGFKACVTGRVPSLALGTPGDLEPCLVRGEFQERRKLKGIVMPQSSCKLG